jgi:hypothetical protein
MHKNWWGFEGVTRKAGPLDIMFEITMPRAMPRC